MSATQPQTPSGGQPATKQRHPARRWIIATAVFAVAAIGLAVWAFSLQSDLDDKDAQLAAQQKQIDDQQGVADRLREAASGASQNLQGALGDLGDQLDEIQGTAEATQQDAQKAIDEAEATAADAQDRADAAADDVERAQAQAEESKADADATRACARGYLSAIGSVFEAGSIEQGVAKARDEIEALNASCEDRLGS
jgi:chromosome segregation ATPase